MKMLSPEYHPASTISNGDKTPVRNNNGEVLAIIPARRNSKGVPSKNIKILGTKPLIGYTIEMALAARNIDRVIVSTDSPEIADIAQILGAEVPFLRPENLAGDTSRLEEAVQFSLNKLGESGYSPMAIVLMYPTQPFRKLETIEFLVDKLKSGHDSIAVYADAPNPRHSFYTLNSDGMLVKTLDNGFDPADRRYVTKTGYLYGRRLIRNKHTLGEYTFHINDYRESLDIDEPHHFRFAKEIVKQNLYPF